MGISLQDGPESILLGGAGALLGFLMKLVWDRFRGDSEKAESKLDKLTNALQENTLAISRLEVKMELMTKAIDLVPELERDLNKLGQKIREIKNQN